MLAVLGMTILGACSSDSSSSGSTTPAAGTGGGGTVGSTGVSDSSSPTTSAVSDTSEATATSTADTTGESVADTAAPVIDDTVGDVRGFDGSVITVAGIGLKGQLPGGEFGARARIKLFNDNNEIPGITIQYAEFVDDGLDPAVALSEARRLVTDVGVFAIVGDSSANNPVDYFSAEHVPYFGSGYDYTYCAPDTSTTMWGFGTLGCLIPQAPTVVADSGGRLYSYISDKLGTEHPTVAIFSNDTQSGQDAASFQGTAYEAAGFDVVLKDGIVPPPPVTDYTPYVQQLLTSNDGDAPDVITCLLSTDCIPIYGGLMAAGFTGDYFDNLYSDALVSPMKGSLVNSPFHNLNEDNAIIDEIAAAVHAVNPEQSLETGSVQGYMSTDMFIEALKSAVQVGKSGITPENVQKVASTMTWGIENFAGPTTFPDNFVTSSSCGTILKSDGDAWQTVVPYSCSDKTYPVG